MKHRTTLLLTEFVTHDVKRFIVKKPETFSFLPGQGVELVIDQEKWRDEEGRPFTPTSLAKDHVLEFTIKRYAGHKGVTDRLHSLQPGDHLLMSEPFGTIAYRGPGVFIAGGAGITPFLAIFRQLALDGALAGQSLIFSNKTPADVICEKELRHYFGNRCHLICTRESGPGYENTRIGREYLRHMLRNIGHFVYVCGPEGFVAEVKAHVQELGYAAEAIVIEK